MFSPHDTHGWQVTAPVSLAKKSFLQASHAAAPEWLTAVPAAHGVSTVLPVGAKWPAVVSVHSLRLVRLVALEYVPSLHGSAALAPSGQYEPRVHAWHSWRPVSFINVPGRHLLHVGCSSSSCTVPGLHAVCSMLPVGAKWPAVVLLHSPAMARSVMLE